MLAMEWVSIFVFLTGSAVILALTLPAQEQSEEQTDKAPFTHRLPWWTLPLIVWFVLWLAVESNTPKCYWTKSQARQRKLRRWGFIKPKMPQYRYFKIRRGDSYFLYKKPQIFVAEAGVIPSNPAWYSLHLFAEEPRANWREFRRVVVQHSVANLEAKSKANDQNIIARGFCSISKSVTFNVALETGVAYVACAYVLAVILTVNHHSANLATRSPLFAKLVSVLTTTLSTLQASAISTYESRLLVGSAVVALVLGSVVATSSDDTVDSALIVVLTLVLSSLVLSTVLLSLQFFYALSSVSGGEAWRKVSTSDLCNIVLCLTRIVLCWARYLIYDIQVDSVDLALHYTDIMFDRSALPAHLKTLSATLDIIFDLLQLMLSLFKLVIATFLVWLILDLFVLRPISLLYSRWVAA